MDFKEGERETETEDADAGRRIAFLEGKSNQHSHVIAILHAKIIQLSADFGLLVDEVSSL
jgi:hypothetical protein